LPAAVATPDPPRPSFEEFLGGVRAEALAAGLRAETLDQALPDVEFQPVALERDRAQAEFVLSFDAYVTRRLKPATIKKANEMYAKHRDVLRDVGAAYGVAPRFLVAVWGLESEFGAFRGVRPTIPTLATLAYESRRAAFFRGQLLDALRIVDRGDIPLADLKGSWAGALGQPQFLPSVYLQVAQDFDNDGRKDIWNAPADVFASIAAYLKEHGWKDREGWGQEVRGTAASFARISREISKRESGCSARRAMTQPLPLEKWRALGVRSAANHALPRNKRPASLVRTGKRSFLVSSNYDAILSYNCAQSYALSVSLLADRITER
jgi:membrane-bound lytic murein transglycosylase B